MTEPRTISGTVRRYLLSGPREDELATIEIENAALVAAYDETGEEIELDAISQEDFEHALSEVRARI